MYKLDPVEYVENEERKGPYVLVTGIWSFFQIMVKPEAWPKEFLIRLVLLQHVIILFALVSLSR